MVVGDFNIIFFKKDTPNFCKLNGILQTISLSQVVHTATYTDCNGRATLIDLALVSRKTQLVNCSVIPPLANSDHNGLEFLFKWKPSEKQVRTTPRVIWRYKEADYGKACQMIDETNWDDLLCNEDVNCSATNWHNKFMKLYLPVSLENHSEEREMCHGLLRISSNLLGSVTLHSELPKNMVSLKNILNTRSYVI